MNAQQLMALAAALSSDGGSASAGGGFDEMGGDLSDMLGMSDIAGAELVSGMSDIAGADLLGDLLGDDSSLGDLLGQAQFLSGNDPVSALLGDDTMGFSMNPLNLFRRKKAKQALVRHAINQKLAQNGAAVVPRVNQKARRQVSPLTATVVAGGTAANISSQPQTLFRAKRFVIPASLAPSFTVQDIKVGNVSQFPNTGDVPGEVFAQNGFDCWVDLDTVNPAINLSVAVTNITGGSLTFRGAFVGTSVQ